MTRQQQILILGDGNFSFTLALCQLLYNNQEISSLCTHLFGINELQNIHIMSTSFDSKDQLLSKYQESKDILKKISRYPLVTVRHGINAWELSKCLPDSTKFDVILWNHPHLGTEDFKLHRFLMAHFFESVSHAMNNSCRIILSLVKGQEDRWNLLDEACKKHLNLTRVMPMKESDWPGYVCKRNMHGKSFKNIQTKRHTQSSMTSNFFIFTNASCDSDLTNEFTLLDHCHQEVLHELQPTPFKSTPSNESYTCPYCQKILTSPRAYKQHVHMVHELKQFGENWSPNRLKTISCSKCKDRKFATIQDLWQHETNIHTQLQEFENLNVSSSSSFELDCSDEYIPCDVCGQAVVNKDFGMELHLESLKPAMGLDMSCMLCSKKFIEFRALYQHYKFCRLCGLDKSSNMLSK